MKKHLMLGVNSKTQMCCTLECLLPFEQLDEQNLEEKDFAHGATNWCGQDEIKRTLVIHGAKETGRVIKLDRPLVYSGIDHDMGHEYPWRFHVDEIRELEGKYNA